MIVLSNPVFVSLENNKGYWVVLISENNKPLGNRTGDTSIEATNNAIKFADRIAEARKRYSQK